MYCVIFVAILLDTRSMYVRTALLKLSVKRFYATYKIYRKCYTFKNLFMLSF